MNEEQKERKKANMKAYYQANKNEIKAYSKSYYEANKDAKKAYLEANKDKKKSYDKAYHQSNKDEINAKSKAYHEANKDENNAKRKAWALANPEKLKATAKAWYQAHPEKVNANGAKRHAAKLKRTPTWFSELDKVKIECLYQLAAMFEREEGVKYHLDHIIPLQGKKVSGLHIGDNVRVILASQNLSKHNSFVVN